MNNIPHTSDPSLSNQKSYHNAVYQNHTNLPHDYFDTLYYQMHNQGSIYVRHALYLMDNS